MLKTDKKYSAHFEIFFAVYIHNLLYYYELYLLPIFLFFCT